VADRLGEGGKLCVCRIIVQGFREVVSLGRFGARVTSSVSGFHRLSTMDGNCGARRFREKLADLRPAGA
jgi:hypothetical protein